MLDKIDTKFEDTDLSSNMEDYMEAIAVLSRTNKVVRVKDIAKKLEIKMPSVTAALNKLRDLDLIEYEKYGFVELTKEGEIIAARVYQRHSILCQFFTTILEMDPKEADNVACRVEHDLSPDACIQINKFIEFYKNEEKLKKDWIGRLRKVLNK